MKNRFMNHHSLEINAADVYYLSGDWVGVLLDTFVLTPLLSPPPPTSPLNITTHYNNTTLKVLVILPLLCPHVHIGSLWVFVVTFGLAWSVIVKGLVKKYQN